MKLGPRSTLADVAIAVGDALRRAGIRAVLTGGACACFYSAGAYHSLDADFILVGECAAADLDRAMGALEFKRIRERYVHPVVSYFVEFPAGPLGIGEDFAVRPIWRRRKLARMLMLSATDSCRDRLAAYYHWQDRQALAAAVAIAMHERVSLSKVKRWSDAEGHAESYKRFLAELARARTARQVAVGGRKPRRGA